MKGRHLALLCACVVFAACASDGRTLRQPAPGATAPPVPGSSTDSGEVGGQAGTGTATGFVLSSTAFTAGGAIPVVYTCDGANLSPPLAWGSIPSGTVELAVTLIDPDANNFIHWVMADIDPSVQAFGEGSLPDGVVQATNSTNKFGWTGPCPPKGPPHHYVFTLYALTQPSGITDGMPGKDAVAKLTQHKSPTATLVGTYTRAG
jgi:Raf kinase inhibitor-like YbhB/YbcL family protein